MPPAGTAVWTLPSFWAPAARPAPDPDALTGEIDDGSPEAASGTLIAPARRGTDRPGDAAPAADPVARLRALMADKRDETAEILRSWMEESEREDAG